MALDSVSESTVSLSWSGEAASYTIMNGSTQVATGIADAEDGNIGISAAGLRIVVEGAEHQDIRIYTVDGRCVRTQTDASAAEEFAMDAAGVYVVKVGDHTAKRVVVMR